MVEILTFSEENAKIPTIGQRIGKKYQILQHEAKKTQEYAGMQKIIDIKTVYKTKFLSLQYEQV